MRLLALLLVFATDVWAGHAYSQFGDVKYPCLLYTSPSPRDS